MPEFKRGTSGVWVRNNPTTPRFFFLLLMHILKNCIEKLVKLVPWTDTWRQMHPNWKDALQGNFLVWQGLIWSRINNQLSYNLLREYPIKRRVVLLISSRLHNDFYVRNFRHTLSNTLNSCYTNDRWFICRIEVEVEPFKKLKCMSWAPRRHIHENTIMKFQQLSIVDSIYEKACFRIESCGVESTSKIEENLIGIPKWELRSRH